MPVGGWLCLGLWEDVGHAREGIGAAQLGTHTHIHPCSCALGNGRDWRGKGSRAWAVRCGALGVLGSGAQGLLCSWRTAPSCPARWAAKLFACGRGIVAPQRPLGLFPSPGEAAADCFCSPVSLPGSKPSGSFPSPSWAHVAPCSCHSFLSSLAGCKHGDCLAAGPFSPIPMSVWGVAVPGSPGSGGRPAQGDGMATWSSIPCLVPQPSLQAARVGQAAPAPR